MHVTADVVHITLLYDVDIFRVKPIRVHISAKPNSTKQELSASAAFTEIIASVSAVMVAVKAASSVFSAFAMTLLFMPTALLVLLSVLLTMLLMTVLSRCNACCQE